MAGAGSEGGRSGATVDLRAFGWSDALEAHARSFEDDLVPARVVAEHRSRFRIVSARGEAAATVAGRMRHDAEGRADLPAVGDWVLVDAAGDADLAVIRHVLPRLSCFTRKVAGERTEPQVIAANINCVWLAVALDQAVSLRRIERYLALAWESGATPVIVLTKSDLADDAGAVIDEVGRVAIAVPIHAVSGVTGAGVDALEAYLQGHRTVALLGPSGVGKSTLINRLLGEDVMRTGAVREGDHKGRHTTTHRQLIAVPGGGLIVDTPGMRELQLWDAEGGVRDTFGDIEELAAECRFADCAHAGEPGCAVLQAVADGALDEGRLESWRKLVREQAYLDRREDARARAAHEREIRTIMRSVRHHPKYRK